MLLFRQFPLSSMVSQTETRDSPAAEFMNIMSNGMLFPDKGKRMKTTSSITLTLCCTLLAGCQSEPAHSPQDSVDRCNTSAVEKLVGEQANPELLDRARRESGATVARIIRPGDVVTLEYNAHRLTLTTDEALIVQQVGCG